MRKSSTLALLFLLTPCTVSASVRITEILFDPPGSNAGTQWIEVTNFGTTPIDLSHYRFSEGGTNHKLSTVQGTTSLLGGASLVISNGPDTLIGAGYTGALVKSSFSLAVAGETIALKDAAGNTADSVTYSSSWGGKSDGNSLHYTPGGFVPGAPDPGVYSDTPPAAVHSGAKEDTAKVKGNSSKQPAKASTNKLVHSLAATPAVAPESHQESNAWWEWTAGIVALVVFGVAASQLLSRGETKSLPDEFDFE